MYCSILFLFIIYVSVEISKFLKTFLVNREYKYLFLRQHRKPININKIISFSKSLNGYQNNLDIALGSLNAENSITIIASLTCGGCYETLLESIDLFERSNKDFLLRIKFCSKEENYIKDNEVLNYIYSYYIQLNVSQFIVFFKEFLIKYYIEKNLDIAYINIKQIKNFTQYFNSIEKLKIEYTPTLLINDKILPVEYSVNDLKYYILEFF